MRPRSRKSSIEETGLFEVTAESVGLDPGAFQLADEIAERLDQARALLRPGQVGKPAVQSSDDQAHDRAFADRGDLGRGEAGAVKDLRGQFRESQDTRPPQALDPLLQDQFPAHQFHLVRVRQEEHRARGPVRADRLAEPPDNLGRLAGSNWAAKKEDFGHWDADLMPGSGRSMPAGE